MAPDPSKPSPAQRFAKAATVILSLVLAALLGVVTSDAFRDAISELGVWGALLFPAIVAALTQLIGAATKRLGKSP